VVKLRMHMDVLSYAPSYVYVDINKDTSMVGITISHVLIVLSTHVLVLTCQV
jgi:hypothetical protein